MDDLMQQAWRRLDGMTLWHLEPQSATPRRQLKLQMGTYGGGAPAMQVLYDGPNVGLVGGEAGVEGPTMAVLTVNMPERVDLQEDECLLRWNAEPGANATPDAWEALLRTGLLESTRRGVTAGFVADYAMVHRLARCPSTARLRVECDHCMRSLADETAAFIEVVQAADTVRRLKRRKT